MMEMYEEKKIVVHFEMLLRQLPTVAEKNHDNLQSLQNFPAEI
jgi:hypothetical protein